MFVYDDLTNPNGVPYPADSYGPDALNGNLPGQGISQPFEVDLIPMDLAGGVDYAALVSGLSLGGGSLPDPYLEIYFFDNTSQTFHLIDEQDNSSLFGSAPYIEFNAPFTGTYYLGVTDVAGGTGDYTLAFSASGPAPAPFVGGE
jgi:hypothetical protein